MSRKTLPRMGKKKATGKLTAGQRKPTSPLSDIRAVRSPKAACCAMGYVQKELAGELSRLTGRAISAEMVQHWEAGRRPLPLLARRAYGQLMANYLSRMLGGQIGVTISVNSPWRVHAWRECALCGKWFELHTARSKFCGCQRR
jgi:hypothetical protein